MIVKNAYYPKQMPTQIVVESLGGKYFAAAMTPFRTITEAELRPLAVFTCEMGDEIPGHTLTFYGLERKAESPLKRERQRLGLTQRQLSEASGVNIRQIQKIESGEIKPENVSLSNAVRLADALGVEPKDLLP